MKVIRGLFRLAFLGVVSIIPSTTTAFSAPTASLRSLLATHEKDIASLREIASGISDDEAVAPPNDVFYLRYVLNDKYDDDEQRIAALKSNLQWRMNDGNSIVTGARESIRSATEGGGGWNNEPVRNAAPHAELINAYLSSTQVITTSLPSTNDLVYCIRAGFIDDKGLMSAVTVDQMVDFFLYCKEVNAAVADARSAEVDSLIRVVTCNDLSGVKLIGGSSDFRTALSGASKKANELYPSLNGRTLMLNLPTLARALVKLFTPLLPEAVRNRIRFESGPLKNVGDLREIAEGGVGRDEFLGQVEVLAYSD